MGKRVALLARPGVACDRLRGALADAGADLVLEADPLTLEPATLDAAQVQVVLVALDAQTEEALDRFEAALQDPSIEVIFEEAELAARREGWEAARWGRHLAAKLHRHDDVLPPGGQAAPASLVDTTSDWAPEDVSGLEVALGADPRFDFETVMSPAPEVVSTGYAFDPLLAEVDFDGHADMDSPPSDASAFDPSLNFSYDGDVDTVGKDISIAAFSPPGGEFNPSDDLSLDELGGNAPQPLDVPAFSPMFDGDFAAIAAAGSVPLDFPGTPAAPSHDKPKQVLELVSDDSVMVLGPAGYDQPGDDGIAASNRFKRDLAGLESSIAGMELVEDRVVAGPAQAQGLVLVMAGIGGPDAVRQLLGALPESFPRPVLVQQRLDGGRYDKLVAQMQRATPVLVKLAEPGLPAIAGVIYIMPAGVGIKVEDAGIQFHAGDDDVLAALPSADSAVLLLSGSDPEKVDAVMNHSWAGALVMGQSPDGCYDAAAPIALLARGGGSGQPAELAERLSQHWRS